MVLHAQNPSRQIAFQSSKAPVLRAFPIHGGFAVSLAAGPRPAAENPARLLRDDATGATGDPGATIRAVTGIERQPKVIY